MFVRLPQRACPIMQYLLGPASASELVLQFCFQLLMSWSLSAVACWSDVSYYLLLTHVLVQSLRAVFHLVLQLLLLLIAPAAVIPASMNSSICIAHTMQPSMLSCRWLLPITVSIAREILIMQCVLLLCLWLLSITMSRSGPCLHVCKKQHILCIIMQACSSPLWHWGLLGVA